MIDWRFTLNPDTDSILADEPTGWDDASISIVRDKKLHGISIAFSVNELGFYGEAAAFIQEQKETYGAAAQVFLKIEALCDEETQYEETFRLDFMRYSEQCGDDCRVNIGFEQISCFSAFKDNYEKAVNLESEIALDNSTALTTLTTLKQTLSIPAKAIRLRDDAEVNPETDPINLADPPFFPDDEDIDDDTAILPPFQQINESGLGSFAPNPIFDAVEHSSGLSYPPYTAFPALINATELLGDIQCEISETTMSFRLKGSVNTFINQTWQMIARVDRLPVGGDPGTPGDWVREYNAFMATAAGETIVPYDHSASFTLPLQQGDLVYLYIQLVTSDHIDDFEIVAHVESFVTVESKVLCEDTTADLFLIHETLYRLAEATSEACLKVRSDYYGRLDSEPLTYDADGCGALKAITNGLKIRNAPAALTFMTMKEMIEELNKIDNIGFGLLTESNGDQVMRVEPYEYFYQDFEMIRLPFINQGKRSIIPEDHIGIIKFGYSNWQAERVAGLDEFNSTREYRSTLTKASAALDIISSWIAGGYIWEYTRQQTFAATGAADTKYDNNTFIVCLMRSYYSTIIVEQGASIIDSPANMFDPDTVYNFRISPLRNFMRWFKNIAGQFVDFTNTANKFLFSQATGNYIAEGMIDDDCSPEGSVITENEDIDASDFKQEETATPKLKPELFIFEYPMSLADFLTIRANPYGYISYQCGTGDYRQAFVMSIKYNLTAGKASFELKEKY